jgi:hypothetical protein
MVAATAGWVGLAVMTGTCGATAGAAGKIALRLLVVVDVAAATGAIAVATVEAGCAVDGRDSAGRFGAAP